MLRKFNGTDWCLLQWSGAVLVLINLAREALGLKETRDPLLLLNIGGEVDLAAALDRGVVVQFDWVEQFVGLSVLFDGSSGNMDVIKRMTCSWSWRLLSSVVFVEVYLIVLEGELELLELASRCLKEAGGDSCVCEASTELAGCL